MKNKFLKTIFIVIILFQTGISSSKVNPGTPLIVSTEKRTYIYIFEMPEGAAGWNIYKKLDRENVKLNEEIIKPIESHTLLKEALGEDFEYIKRYFAAETDFELYRRLKREKQMSIIASIQSIKTAKAMGKLFIVEEPPKWREKYVYLISFLNKEGKEIGTKEFFYIPEREIPVPPENISAVSGDKEVKIKWRYKKWGDINDLVVGFNLYRKSENETKYNRINEELFLRLEVEGKTEFEYTDRDVENGITYYYYLTSVKLGEIESGPSKEIKVQPEDITPPPVIEGLRAESKEGKVYLSWKMATDLDAEFYNVYKGSGQKGEFKKIAEKIPVDKPYYIDEENIISGKTYFYKITCVDKKGNESRPTAPYQVRVSESIPPPPPEVSKAEIKNGEIIIEWKEPLSEDLLGYRIYRGFDKEKLFTVASLKKGETKFIDEGIKKGYLKEGKVYFAVSAYDFDRNESQKNIFEINIPDTTPPLPPLQLRGRLTQEGELILNLTKSLSTDVEGYRIYRKDEGGWSLIAKLSKEELEYREREVEKGRKYIYYATAFDTSGNESEKTEELVIKVVDFLPPTPPEILEIVYFDETGEVKIEWEKVKDKDISGYYVLKSPIQTGVFEKINKILITEPRFVTKEIKIGEWVGVVAVDTSGNESKMSKPMQILKK